MEGPSLTVEGRRLSCRSTARLRAAADLKASTDADMESAKQRNHHSPVIRAN
jgi:hypothetical protein